MQKLNMQNYAEIPKKKTGVNLKAKTDNISEMNMLRKIFEGSCVATLGALEKPDGTLME